MVAKTTYQPDHPAFVTEKEPALLKLVAEGDRAAYRELFDHYLSKLVYYLQPLTEASGLDYQDIIQDVFIAIWEKRENIAIVRSFDRYLFRMAKNRFLDLYRKERSAAQLVYAYSHIRKEEVPLPADHLLFEQYREAAARAIAGLSPKLKSVFMMSNEYNLSLDQIARRLELPKETVKKRLWMANMAVKNYLKGHMQLLLLLGLEIFFC